VPETPLKTGICKRFLGFESLRVRTGGDRDARHALVGERACGTGNHTLATGDAGGIAHRRIEIERDAGGITFAHAAQDKIALDFVAAADAAIAEMQASWSTAIANEESSLPRAIVRLQSAVGKRRPLSRAPPIRSRRKFCARAQGEG